MTLRLTLLSDYAYLLTPSVWWGKLVWAFFALGVFFLFWRFRKTCRGWSRRQWGLFALLSFLTPFATLFVALRLPAGAALLVPDLPQDYVGPALSFFSAAPWILAAGWLNPCAAFFLGLLSGLLRAWWDTHSLLTPVNMALLALLFSLAVRQNYRSLVYRWLRNPLVAGLVLTPVYTALYILGAFTLASSGVAAGLDYALSNVGMATLAFGGEIMLAAGLAQVMKSLVPEWWWRPASLQPAPAERSLERRFLSGMGALTLLLLLVLLVGDWIVAGRAARLMLRDRLESTAQMAAESVPFYLETGQNLAVRIATLPALASADSAELQRILSEQMLFMPYFDELLVYGLDGNLIAAYPAEVQSAPDLQLEEITGLTLAINGVGTQVYAIPPRDGQGAARVSFLVGVQGADGLPVRVLIGRSALDTNPLMRPLLNSLEKISTYDGTGFLLDEQGRVLFDSRTGQSMYPYPGERAAAAAFYDDLDADGTRRLVYYQPTTGRDWAVVLIVPAREAQQLALNIAGPLSLMIFVLAFGALILLRLALRAVTASLYRLSKDANLIAQGQLNHAVTVAGVDELGRLGEAFEQMRLGLKARLDELNRLLRTSQAMASSLDMGESLRPILESARATGASAVRVILLDDTLPEMVDMPQRFALGRKDYAYLDEQLLQLTRHEERLLLSGLKRIPLLSIPDDAPYPAAVLALPLRQKDRYYGVLWLAYDARSHVDEADVRFITTLAGQAALAVANASLFLQAEVGRQHLEAILASTPDPVLVTDSLQRLLLANPAAIDIFGDYLETARLKPVDEVFKQPELVDLLKGASSGQDMAELALGQGRVYLATASSVILTGGQNVGRVCILRDVTYLKEMDAMKSEFVSTVSHDLRSPLTLMRGYATMLEMVGELNEQQRNYVRKIVVGVENMSRLVNNLLDLGRIEAGVGLNLEKISLHDMADKVVGALQLYANQKKIELTTHWGKDLPAVLEADSALLYQALYNLLENALKYTPEGGRVTFGIESRGDALLFSVKDTGIGISPEDQKHLFEKFFRSSRREARAQKGTGLGLAIVRSIVERHGGRIWVESRLGEGSTFYLAMPLEQALSLSDES